MTTNKEESSPFVPIAVCGYGYRLPGGLEDDKAVWDLLSKRGFVQENVGTRYGKGEVPHDGFTQDNPRRVASPYEGLITNGRELEFDCSLFGMSMNDAKRMDPQIKMMLMVTWEALQCAGMDQAALHNSDTGVFIGQQLSSAAGWRPPMGANAADVPGRSGSMIANRISYHFNWMGPSFSVATACSSGITALDAAIKSLHEGESKVAAFGAVNYLGHLQSSVGFNTLGIISKTGTSRSFDKDANGYMRAEGAFVYILKRLADAERDGDKIFGVIRGCALNTAGAEPNADVLTQGRMILAPTQHAQASLMRQVAKKAGISPLEVDYLEAHATGTVVGDSTEGNAIAAVYGSPDRRSPLRLASTRSNLGHMEASSFTSSFLKVLLMLQRRQFLPISSHFKEPNPKIPFDETNMRVQTSLEEFPEHKVMVGINSFGFGGANGHCIIEEYRPVSKTWSRLPGGLENKTYMVPISAKSDEALVENARRLAERLIDLEGEVDMYTLAANLSVRMTHHRVRKSFAVKTVADLRQQLIAFAEHADEDGKGASRVSGSGMDGSPSIAMVFPGQGSQWPGCGKELYKTEVVFRRVVDAIDLQWIKLSGRKLSEVAFEDGEGAADVLNECQWAQPVTFLIQAGIFEMLKAQGVHPSVVVGHSAGEAASAYASGAYCLEEMCQLVYHRSQLQQKLAGSGRMLVLMQDVTSVKETLSRLGFSCGEGDGNDAYDVEIACVNSPTNTVVCGTAEVIAQVQQQLESDKQPPGKLIPGNIAFHSSHTNAIKEKLLEALTPLDGPEGRSILVPMISTVSGTPVKEFNAEYWWANVRKKVDLQGAMATIRKRTKPDVLIEISPHITLRSPIRDCYGADGDSLPNYVYSLVRGVDTAASFARCLGSCFECGMPLDFKATYPRPMPVTHLLPPYAMKRERVIDDLYDDSAIVHQEYHCAGPLLGKHLQGSTLSYQAVVTKQAYTWMADHVVQGKSILPAAGYVELLLEAFKGHPIRLIRTRVSAPFILDDEARYIHTHITPYSYAPHRFEFSVTSRAHADLSHESTIHCVGVVEKVDRANLRCIPPEVPMIHDPTSSEFEGYESKYPNSDSFYAAMLAKIGDSFSYGPFFRAVQKIDMHPSTKRLHCELAIDPELWSQWDKMGYVFHPTILDGALQLFIVFIMEASDFAGVPLMMDDFVILGKPSSERVTCVYEPPDYLKDNNHQKGQLALGLGERQVGTILIYDGKTSELIAYLGTYVSYTSNDKRSDIKRSKHYLSWQPKDDCNAKAVAASAVNALSSGCSCEDAAKLLIQDMIEKAHPRSGAPFFVNVAECIVGMPPSTLAMEESVSTLNNAPAQYTLLSADVEFLVAKYQEIGARNQDAHLRFFKNETLADKGFLRPGMFELFIIRSSQCGAESGTAPEEELINLAELITPGGLVLLESNVPEIDIPDQWMCLWKTPAAENGATASSVIMLLQAGYTMIQKTSEQSTRRAGTSALIDDSLGFSQYWRNHIHGTTKSSSVELRDTNLLGDKSFDFGNARALERVDFFAMSSNDETEDSDPVLFVAPLALTEWVKQFAAERHHSDDLVPCIFTVFTSGAVNDVASPAQTGVWGAVRAMAAEIGDDCKVDFRLIDVATKEDLQFVSGVETFRERELCVHNGRVWTSRLVNSREAASTVDLSGEDEAAFRLETDNSGVLANLQFRTYRPRKLGPNDVEILVKAAALNFRDIMVSLGKLPLLSYERSMLGRTVGMECCGEVVKCGASVKNVRVGDKVIAMHGGCIANRLTLNSRVVYRKPDHLNFEQGSSVGSVYVTAYYALCYLARMRAGQSILVHSALGGVGQAAIALAKVYGARVYATAGSEAKRIKLRKMGCVDAFDSHSNHWFGDLMMATNGEGVDIVLNSLAGEHIDLCLESLTAGGWHCEIGKVDIFADRPMKMAVFRKNLRVAAIDIDRLMVDDPELVGKLTEECLKLLEEKKVSPPPYTTFPYSEYQRAISCMMKGQHQGKIVLTPPQPNRKIPVIDGRPLFGVGRDGEARTVLLSGCFGGFGLRVFSYVVALGAKNIVMLDRDASRSRSVDWLCQQSSVDFLLEEDLRDVNIQIVHADVGSYDDVRNAIEMITQLGMPPLGSVFHLAGLLDDKLVGQMDEKSFTKVFRPKANGAWNLHRATLDCKGIDHFVMLSSTSSVFGNPGQTNYSAANSFQDGLAVLRQQNGKPAVSFCMAAVTETGMAARDPQLLHLMKAKGMPAISCISAIEALDAALRCGQHPVHVAALVTDIDAEVSSADYLRSWAQLTRNSSAFNLASSGALSEEEIIDLVATRVASLCGVEKVDPEEPFSSYGLNSISVAELIVFLKQEMAFSISPMELMTSATCKSIAKGVLTTVEDSESNEALAAEGDNGETSSDDENHDESKLSIKRHKLASRFAPSLEEHFDDTSMVPFFQSRFKEELCEAEDTASNPITPVSDKFFSDGFTAKVRQVAATLPPDCKRAFFQLKTYLRDLGDAALAPATPVRDMRNVMLTGATGFVGRHFIVDLLKCPDVHIETIFCPVRAKNDDEAFQRVINAMKAAGVWDQGFSSRIYAFAADLQDDKFDCSTEIYNKLVAKVDAVYHFASDLSLSASFETLEKKNCRFFRPIARLCLSVRRKSLFLASTLGIFPQYTANFGQDMADKRIDQDAMPDMSDMKRLLPLQLCGYPWSKVVIELAALELYQTKGVPLAVFRLPEMFTNSTFCLSTT
eukprot:scaffold1586_cov158-Amphora_coffeaeformis.AAC.3